MRALIFSIASLLFALTALVLHFSGYASLSLHFVVISMLLIIFS